MKLLIGFGFIAAGILWGLFWWIQAAVSLSVTGRAFPPLHDLVPALMGAIPIFIGIVVLMVAK